MNVLILGSGGREHAFAWKISQSPKCDVLYIAPGNAGTALCGTNVEISVNDFPAIEQFVLENRIELVVVGPEEPLVLGIHDYFLSKPELASIHVIGPKKDGAIMEGSKDFSKAFMKKYGIPTAAYNTFDSTQLPQAIDFLKTLSPPYVLKADGLAAGKGVIISESFDEASEELELMLINEKFGKASSKVVIEEFLRGIELSVFVLTDGKSYKILPEAKDYKRIGEEDTGLNTGGMGAISPVPFAGEEFIRKVEERVIKPTINGLQKEGIHYKGFIFIGLMNCGGDPYVIEYNVRMGDPETEVVIPRIKSDLLDLFIAVGKEDLKNATMEIEPAFATTVMAVSGGYPGDYEKGKEIKGLSAKNSESLVFHAGTKNEDGIIKTNGGRVLAVTSMGNTIESAVKKSYQELSLISYDGIYYRRDIGKDLIS